MNKKICLLMLAAPLLLMPYMAKSANATPRYLGAHHTTADDRRAIEHLLSTYTTSVSTGNEKAFEALLLSLDIPFGSADDMVTGKKSDRAVDVHQYPQFRQQIFQSGIHYTQHFYNVRIKQDGPLAQVSMDFVTKEADNAGGGYGFKTLQLLKVHGQWKIASEFYTGYPMPRTIGQVRGPHDLTSAAAAPQK